MIFPAWLEQTLDLAQQALPLVLLMGVGAVAWWASLRPAR